MFYNLLRPLIFKFSPECAHDLAIMALKNNVVPGQNIPYYPRLASKILDMQLPHPIGLAAGFDKNAECIKNLARQGFAFLELGSVTPKAQYGNPKPRIFRLEQQRSLVNCLGFNNKGIDYFLDNIQTHENSQIPLGINIGKNKDSTEDDYLFMLEKINHVTKKNYITINISSPNTPGLRDLQKKDMIEEFLQKIAHKVQDLNLETPIFLKISPDMQQEELLNLVYKVLEYKCFKGLIISNTTIQHNSGYQGGLSGKELFKLSTENLREISKITQDKLIIIGVGGVFSADDVIEKIQAGAHLVQIYTAFVYEGFGIIPKILRDLNQRLENMNINNIQELNPNY